MAGDGGHGGAVAAGPATKALHVEPQHVLQRLAAVQAQLGSQDALGVGGEVDGAVLDGGELVFLEHHALHRVGEAAVRHPVEHHVAHRHLAAEGLVAALGVDDVTEPVEVVGVIERLGRGQSAAATGQVEGAVVVGHAGGVKDLAQGLQGDEH